ncbi:MAG: 3-carboxy-cis,cis-muconate cycloisomerase [Actinomycetes bacterium]
MPSDPTEPSQPRPDEGRGLFGPVSGSAAVDAATSDVAWLQAMLDVEAALAASLAQVGLVPEEAAKAVEEACRADRFDPDALGRAATASGNPVVPLVRSLTEAVPGEAAGTVHRGATSQDVLDTAAMLVVRRATGPLLDDLAAAADLCAGLAAGHRDTVLVGRTLLQQAMPTTFGRVAAGWLVSLDDARQRLSEVRRTRLAVSFGGAAGTLASLGEHGVSVAAYLADALGLAEPVLPWHTDRVRVGELASALGVAAGAAGGVALDLTLLASTEVGEVSEAPGGGRGGSSTMPHKRNPVGAVMARGCAQRAPGLVASLLAAMPQEHQRAAGAWHAEWLPLTDLLRAAGGAAGHLRASLDGMAAHPARMRANLDLTGGLLLAEQVTTALAPALGRLAAHDAVQTACRTAVEEDRPLADVLRADPAVTAHLRDDDIDRVLDPSAALGSAGQFVDRALAAHRQATP